VAASLARAAGAKLRIERVLESEVESLREDAQLTAATAGVDAEVTVAPGSPAKALLELSEAVDLLVIRLRRSGPAEPVHPGSTVRTLLDDALCPIVVVAAVCD
jgi:nucleotide-binding universal stress UspA family protein